MYKLQYLLEFFFLNIMSVLYRLINFFSKYYICKYLEYGKIYGNEGKHGNGKTSERKLYRPERIVYNRQIDFKYSLQALQIKFEVFCNLTISR